MRLHGIAPVVRTVEQDTVPEIGNGLQMVTKFTGSEYSIKKMSYLIIIEEFIIKLIYKKSNIFPVPDITSQNLKK